MESGGEATPLLLGSGTATPSRFHPLKWAPLAVGGAGLTALIVGTLVGILALPTQAPQPVEQIAVNFGADATSTLVVSWASFSARADAGVRWGLSPTSLTGFAVAASRTYVEPTDPTYTSPTLYNATITNLAPNTRVFYRVGDSALLNVSTSVAVGAPTHIAILGDLGTTGNSSDTVAAIVAAHGVVPFQAALLVGDLSYADGTQSVWDEWGRLVEPLASTIPMLTAVGNHEWFDQKDHSFRAFVARTHNPAYGPDGNGTFFSIDLGLVHLVVLSGYCPLMVTYNAPQQPLPCFAPGSPQLTWLRADLASVDRARTPWVVASVHQPWANSNTAHSIAKEGLPIQAAIEDTLHEGRVDLLVSGHVHAYERSCPMYNYTCVPGGLTCITVGDGGNREGLATQWVQPQPAWSIFRNASYGHGLITASNSSHLLWEWYDAGQRRVLDSAWLTRVAAA